MCKWVILIALSALIFTSGCAVQTATPLPVVPSDTARPQPPTFTPTPTLTHVPTLTRSPTATFTNTPSPTATTIPHPMEIEAMRQGSYPGSEIVIEKELERGVNYRRYYAWYLSEGLRIYGLLTIPLAQMPEGGYPALVFLHGYIAPAEYRTTERYLAYTDWLSRYGYVVFKMIFAGMTGRKVLRTGRILYRAIPWMCSMRLPHCSNIRRLIQIRSVCGGIQWVVF